VSAVSKQGAGSEVIEAESGFLPSGVVFPYLTHYLTQDQTKEKGVKRFLI
jgi:hypothetical protein